MNVEQVDVELEPVTASDPYREKIKQVKVDGDLRVATNGHILAVRKAREPSDKDFPDWRRVATEPKAGNLIFAIDAQLLLQLALAIGPIKAESDDNGEIISHSRDTRVILEIDPSNLTAPIAVIPVDYFGDSAGAIMPVRVDNSRYTPRERLKEFAEKKAA